MVVLRPVVPYRGRRTITETSNNARCLNKQKKQKGAKVGIRKKTLKYL